VADRFDKFTERAQRVLTLAQQEAERFDHNYIGTEHLLLGLLREDNGVAAMALANLGVELDMARSQVDAIIGRGEHAAAGAIGLTPRAKKVIELAVDEARRFGHHYIGTEHLLLGLVREGEGIAAGVLESLGVSLERVRAGVQLMLGTVSQPAFEDTPIAVNEPTLAADRLAVAASVRRLSPQMQAAFQRSIGEAERLGHQRVDVEHFLLAILRDEESAIPGMLERMGVDIARLRSELESAAGRAEPGPNG
jgi:ATP-dependent Clp protease ATP-binding subunit ClpC